MTSKYPFRKDSSFSIQSVTDPLEDELKTSHSRRESWTHMDCCPVMVSDLPVICSRVDGLVTDRPNSMRPYPDWGKFLWAHSALPCPDVSSLSLKGNRWHLLDIGTKSAGTKAMKFTIWLSVKGDKWRVVRTFPFSRKVSTLPQVSQSDFTTAKTYLESFLIISAPHCSTKRNIKLSFVNISSFMICFSLQYQIILSGNSTHRIGQMLPNAHFDDSYCSFHQLFLFYEMSNISPLLSVMYNVGLLSWNDLSLPQTCAASECPWGKLTAAFAQTQSRSFCFQHVTEICSVIKVKRVIFLSQKWLFVETQKTHRRYKEPQINKRSEICIGVKLKFQPEGASFSPAQPLWGCRESPTI